MNTEGFKNKVMKFMVKLRTENCIDEGLYDSISDDLSSQRVAWEEQGAVPLAIFEVCVDLVNYIAGGNRFLSEDDQERLEDINDEIYGVLMGLE